MINLLINVCGNFPHYQNDAQYPSRNSDPVWSRFNIDTTVLDCGNATKPKLWYP